MNSVKKNSSKAIFLDRDGVLNYAIVRNGKPYPPQTLEELNLYEDAFQVLHDLKHLGFKLIVVTNQPDIASGCQTLEIVGAMHKRLMDQLPLDDIKMCIDATRQDYKPNPGMLLQAADEIGIDLKQSYMIGDRWRDIGAGINAGCYKTILIDRSYNEEMVYKPDYICQNLIQARDYIFEQEGLQNAR